MIPKSMSRKTASFDQLIAYMDSEKSDARFDLHHNCYARGQKNLAGEFFANSQTLKSRKNGNVLYHEIVSITLENGVDRTYAKECLREIVLEYIAARCPRNMAYGALHEDHADHLHYHLVISANERGDEKRFWHTKAAFDVIKRDLEEHVLTQYPDLKQRRVVTAKPEEKKQSKKAAEMKRQNKKLTKRDQVRETIVKAMMHTTSLDAFHANLGKAGYTYYARGKHHGVKVQHEDGQLKNYRFATIGVHESFEEFLGILDGFKDADGMASNQQNERPAENDLGAAHEGGSDAQSSLDCNSSGIGVGENNLYDNVEHGSETEERRNKKPEVAGEKENHGHGAERDADKQSEDDAVAQDLSAGQTTNTEPPDFYQELQDRRAKRNEKKAAKSDGKRRGKPRR